MLKNIISQMHNQKVYIINRKTFYDQAIDSDIKRYKEIRKWTTGKGEDYTAGLLLHYNHIKNHDKLITDDLKKLKKLDADLEATH